MGSLSLPRSRDEPMRTTQAIRDYRAAHPYARYVYPHRVNDAIRDGSIPYYTRPGGQVRYIRLTDLEAWAAQSFVSM